MSSAAVQETVWRKKMDLTAKKKAEFVHSEHGDRQVFILTGRTVLDIERVRWRVVEQRRRFFPEVWDPAYAALGKACPASTEIKGVRGWGNGIVTYERGEDGGISFNWADTAPRKTKIVLAFIQAEARMALLNSRLLVWDDILSWKMFPQYGLEYGGCPGITRYIVNGRSYIAKRVLRGWNSDKKAEMFVYSKFSYPGWEQDDVYREVSL